MVARSTAQILAEARTIAPDTPVDEVRETFANPRVKLLLVAEGDRFLGTLDSDHLRFTESRRAINQPCGGRAEHHPARRSDRLHPLSHSDLLTDRGVTQSAGADFTGDDLTRVESHT